ncbi:hypothetical protein AZE42_12855 [Rhizopogon vesiculosus]|uniref:Uncharacterized protein n=1 Tax=Rhizopogon vesiculosus TaxID=180088 RepID=A0A1J8RFQ7_9AGAM|nr:hypothetical protein AZE42_12855 [Rhizopogon vesiculosus]
MGKRMAQLQVLKGMPKAWDDTRTTRAVG